MPEFAFFRVGASARPTITVADAPGIEEAKRHAHTIVETEGCEAVRIWIDGLRTMEVRRPKQTPAPSAADRRGAQMSALRAQGKPNRAIGDEFGIGAERVAQVLARVDAREQLRGEQPNRAALSVRARNVLPLMIHEPEEDPAVRDRLLPGRVAALTRRDVLRTPNAGKSTVAELEAWLWARDLCFDE